MGRLRKDLATVDTKAKIVPCKDEKAWLENRTKGIGASEVASILGLNPFSSPMDVYLEKKGIKTFEGNENTRWGKVFEAPIAERFANDHKVELVDTTNTLFVHPSNPIIRCTPDRLIAGRREGLEIKRTSFMQRAKWGDPLIETASQIPDYYYVQVVWQMLTLGWDAWNVAVLIDSNDYRDYFIPANRDLENIVAERVIEFWEKHIVADVPPIGGDKASSEWLQKAFPKVSRAMLLPASEAIQPIGEEYREAKKALKDAEARVSDLENKIKEAIADSEGIDGGSWVAKWVESNGSSYVDIDALKVALGNLGVMPSIVREAVEQATKRRSSYRRFNFK